MTLRAATYARYSDPQQRESSIADQQRNAHERAAREGWPVVRDYADPAKRGADRKRPEYRRMLADGMTRAFDILLVDDLSRFARDSVEQEQAIRRLEFAGIRIVGCSDGYDSAQASRKITRAFAGLKNEMYSDDLAQKVHRGQRGQALQGRWNGGRPYGYKLRPILDPTQRDPYGNPLRIATELEVNPEQAVIVRRIYERYVAGASCFTIAKDLNADGVPSPGATWRRKMRRASGWMTSAVRVVLRNPLYRGQQRWNVSKFVRDPDSGNYLRRKRPKSEWITHQIEALRIVSDELFEQAQLRTRKLLDGDARLKCGGKSKYVLSGLLVCSECHAHYILSNERTYACSGYLNGRACTNGTRVRRDVLQEKILAQTVAELLAPTRMAIMVKEFKAEFTREMSARQTHATQRPAEIQQLEARLARLRDRQLRGDPDMTAAELQSVIDHIEAERDRLAQPQPVMSAGAAAKVFALVPQAAEECRKQVLAGLDGDPQEAATARLRLKDILGPITLTPGPEPGALWATFNEPAIPVLLRATGGTGYRGERI